MEIDTEKYPVLGNFAKPILIPDRKTLGREKDIRQLRANLAREELSNAILLGPAGVGKTAIVSELAREDTKRNYYEVDLSRMSSSDKGQSENIMASRMKALVDDVERYQRDTGQSIVLFMDEFHQIIELSPAATEAIKPMLARSGILDIHIIAATTFDEYQQFVQPNQALDQRLQRQTIDEPSRNVVINILRSMKNNYVPEEVISDSLYELIYDYSERYLPAEAQPRKSLLLFDQMIGWHNAYGTNLDKKLLNSVIYSSSGINADWNVNVKDVINYINDRVIDQRLASKMVAQRLYISIADMVEENEPQASFLFTGSTGVGKTEMAKALAKSIFGDENNMIRFDMSEYSEENTVTSFRESLTSSIWEKPYSVVLLDEVEKANDAVVRLLLQVLDDGRLSDRNGRQSNFNNSYIIMTTNAGSEIFSDIQSYQSNNPDDDDLGSYYSVIRRALLNDDAFRPELLGRIKCIAPFRPLSDSTMKRIAFKRLGELGRDFEKKHHVKLHIAASVIDYLVFEHFEAARNSDAGGGRALKTRIDQEINSVVCQLIDEHPEIHDVAVTTVGKSSYQNKDEVKGTMKLVISKYERKSVVNSRRLQRN